jgi:hypothetical protein
VALKGTKEVPHFKCFPNFKAKLTPKRLEYIKAISISFIYKKYVHPYERETFKDKVLHENLYG